VSGVDHLRVALASWPDARSFDTRLRREDVEARLAEYDRLRGALELIATQRHSWADFYVREVARNALGMPDPDTWEPVPGMRVRMKAPGYRRWAS
jgi:hypothetical protein